MSYPHKSAPAWLTPPQLTIADLAVKTKSSDPSWPLSKPHTEAEDIFRVFCLFVLGLLRTEPSKPTLKTFFFGFCPWNIFIWSKYSTEVFGKAFQRMDIQSVQSYHHVGEINNFWTLGFSWLRRLNRRKPKSKKLLISLTLTLKTWDISQRKRRRRRARERHQSRSRKEAGRVSSDTGRVIFFFFFDVLVAELTLSCCCYCCCYCHFCYLHQ